MPRLVLCLLAVALCSGQMCGGVPITASDGDEQVSASEPDSSSDGASGDGSEDNEDGEEIHSVGGATDDDGGGDDTGAVDVPETPENPKICYSGYFECADGPVLTQCGTWEFAVNDADAIIGTGIIEGDFASSPLKVNLSGIVDPTPTRFDVVLTNAGGGAGSMSLEFVGPTLELSGPWSHRDDPTPPGVQFSGTAYGSPCDTSP